MQEYPKALYTGDQTHYTMLTANNHEEEQLLRDEGAVDYVDLPEFTPNMKYVDSVGESSKLEVGEFQYNVEVNAHSETKQLLVSAQNDLAEAKAEIERLNAIIEAGIAENEALRRQLGQAQEDQNTDLNELTAAQLRDMITAQGDTTPVGSASYSGSHLISLNDLTLAQLQEMAKSKGIEFKVRDSKGTLIELLMDYQDKELANANSD